MTHRRTSYDEEDSFEIIETLGHSAAKQDFHCGQEFREVTKEKDFILDAFALLGGNENLVSQILERLEEMSYSTTEEEVIREVSARLWSAEETDLGLASPLSQGALLQLLTPHNRDRVHRLVARALLYSSVSPDTRVYASLARPEYHAIIISMERVAGLAGADLPLGHTPQPGGVACSRLAILFHWAQPSQPAPATSKWRADNNRPGARTRKISTSLELELKMLSITDMFAIVICP